MVQQGYRERSRNRGCHPEGHPVNRRRAWEAACFGSSDTRSRSRGTRPSFISMVASFVDLPLERRTGFSEAVVKSVFDDTPPPAEAVVRLEKLLTARPLQDSAKALVLLHEQPQVFQDCRIITDLRPLFGDNDTELRAFTVTHQLRIGYDTPSESSDFYVALEADDLRRLRSAIDRALSKQASLESFSRQAGAVVIAEDPS